MSIVDSVIWATTSRLGEGNMGLPPSSVQRILHVNQLLSSGSAAMTRYPRPQLPVVLSFTTQCIIFQFYSYLILFFFLNIFFFEHFSLKEFRLTDFKCLKNLDLQRYKHSTESFCLPFVHLSLHDHSTTVENQKLRLVQ